MKQINGRIKIEDDGPKHQLESRVPASAHLGKSLGLLQSAKKLICYTLASRISILSKENENLYCMGFISCVIVSHSVFFFVSIAYFEF